MREEVEIHHEFDDHHVDMYKIRSALLIICLLTLCIDCAGNKELRRKKARAKEDLGLSYVLRGDLKAGLEQLIDAAKLDPENPNVHHELALTYKDLGLYKESLAHFKKALALRPEFPEALNDLGTLYALLGKWDLAIASFEKAVSYVSYRTPHFAYNNLGLAYYNKGDYQKAIDSYLEALRLSPSYAICHANLALAYEAMSRWQLAIDAYKKAISYGPENPIAHLNLGKLYLKLNRTTEAAEELRQTIEIDPKGPFAEEAGKLLDKIK